jgi:hypothetical protein
MKRKHTERTRKTNRNGEHHKRNKKNHKGGANKIKRVQVILNMVQVIQNMVLEIIKRESVSLFTIILVMFNFKQLYLIVYKVEVLRFHHPLATS